MKSIYKRSITGSLVVLTIVSCLLLGAISFFILFLAIIIVGQLEFYSLSKHENVKPDKVLGFLSGILVFVSIFFHASGIISVSYVLPFVVLAALFTFIFALYKARKNPFMDIAYTFLGVIYIALPLSLGSYLVFNQFTGGIYSGNILLGFFIILWISDTGAYLFGSAFGKRKFFERISPKKTWEGSIGGAITAIGCSLLLSVLFDEMCWCYWVVMAVIVVVFGMYGDLVESMYKRSINIKDSGNILPGHGGILDRFDCVFLALPAVFAFILFLQIM